MTSLGDILNAARPASDGFHVTIPESWMQGRTTYGGLSSALALAAAKASAPDLPPLRSALIAFVGPLAGTVTVTARLLRRGRNAAWIDATITSAAGIGYRATFLFMAEMASSIAHDAMTRVAHLPPETQPPAIQGPVPQFLHNFEVARVAAKEPAEWLRWVRLARRAGLDEEVALIAIADALPPAALRLAKGPAKVSSLTWTINLLRPHPTTRDGWWLMRSLTECAAGGFSSQRMMLWDADGRPVVEAMQGVAIFD